MARAMARLQAWSLRAGSLDIKSGATFTLFEPGTASGARTPLATPIYAAISGGSPLSTTLTADSTGQYVIFTDDPTRFDVEVSGAGIETYAYPYQSFEMDPSETLTEPRTSLYPATVDGLGGGSVSNQAALAATITRVDASAAGSGVILLPDGEFAFGSGVTPTSGLTIRGNGPSTVLKLDTTSAMSLFSATGTLGSMVLLLLDGDEGDTSITLGSGGAALIGLAAGDYVKITDNSGPSNATILAQWNRVKSVVGDVVTLYDPLYDTYTNANTSGIQKVTGAIQNLTIENLTIDGADATTSAARGIVISNSINLTIRNVTFKNVKTAGVKVEGGYGLRLENLRFDKCGDGLEGDLYIWDHANFSITDVVSERTTSFGLLLDHSCGGRVTGFSATGSGGRGIKIASSRHVTMVNARVDGSSTTGFGITDESHHIIVHGLETIGNTHQGIWIVGTSHHCQIYGAYSRYNQLDNLLFDTNATDNLVEGDIYLDEGPQVSRDFGTRNLVKTRTFGQTKTVVGSTSGPAVGTSYGDLQEMSATMTTTGGKIRAQFTGVFTNSDAGTFVQAGFSLDGGSEVGVRVHTFATTDDNVNLALDHEFTGVAAGSHTVKVRAVVSSGTASAVTTLRALTISEGAWK